MSRQRRSPWRALRLRARLALRRLDRLDRDWHRAVPSWGTSLALHALVLMLLALFVFNGQDRRVDRPMIVGDFAGQLTEDVTSLNMGERAGDPFTDLQTDDAPSLSITTAAEFRPSNQPELPTDARMAANLAGPSLNPAAIKTGRLSLTNLSIQPGRLAEGFAIGTLTAEALSAPFAGRQGPARADLVRREGGTVESEKAVEAGLDWIARHQRPDGGWSLHYQGQCVAPGCPDEDPIESETAATGLALLPLLGAGHTPAKKDRYQATLRRGLEWLIAHQKDDGDLFVGGGRNSHLYSHAIGAMALCEALGVTDDKSLRIPAQRAINFILRSQNPQDGGWRYVPGAPGDTSVFGWQMMALRSARLAGLDVPKKALRGCQMYLDLAAADKRKVTYAYLPGRSASPVMTAEALLSRQYLGWPRNHAPLIKGVGLVAADLQSSQERNIYYWYYATQLLHNMQGKSWEQWNARVRDGLVSMQVTGAGCDRGSWDAFFPQRDRWGSSGGRLYVTSLSLLTLEVYYRYLPLYRVTEGQTNPAEATRDDGELAKDAVKPEAN